MVYPAFAILLVLFTALERTWPGWLLVYGQGPHLVIASVVSIALCAGPVAGCFGGLLGALLLGSVEGAWLGGPFFGYMALGLVLGLLRGELLAERAPVAALVTLAAVPAVALVRLIFAAPPSLGPWLLDTALSAPYSALVAMPVFGLFRAVTLLLEPD